MDVEIQDEGEQLQQDNLQLNNEENKEDNNLPDNPILRDINL